MSGPKSYSVEVFDKQIKTVFLLQSEICLLWDALTNRNDKQNNVVIKSENDDFIKNFKKNQPAKAKPFTDHFEKPLNQNQFNKFYSHIHDFIEQQNRLKKNLENQISRFDTLEQSYLLYLELEELRTSFSRDFTHLKQQLTQHLEQYDAKDENLYDRIIKLKKLGFEYLLPEFSSAMVENIEAEKLKLVAAFEEARRKLHEITNEKNFSEKEFSTLQSVLLVNRNKNLSHQIEAENKLYQTTQEIQLQLQKITDKTQFEDFSKRLNHILNQGRNHDPYFAVELLEEVRQCVKQQDLKTQVTELLEQLAKTQIDASFNENKRNLELQILHELQRVVVKQSDVTRLSENFRVLTEQDQLLKKEKMVALQEQSFIKARLVSVLQDLNYEVVNETEVLDFEKSDNFLLRVPEQPNFLNIRFDASGKMLYNFLIPEDRDELSNDQKSVKLSEMEETCNAFGKMLIDLKNKGLKVELQKEIEISEKALIRLPEKYRETTQSRKISKKTEYSSRNKNLYL